MHLWGLKAGLLDVVIRLNSPNPKTGVHRAAKLALPSRSLQRPSLKMEGGHYGANAT
jgi:hypothetical protein